jgi:hypothetical protein
MHPKLSLNRWMVAAAAAVLSVAVLLAGPSVPAKAAVGAVSRGEGPEASERDRNATDPAGPDHYAGAGLHDHRDGHTKDERSHQGDSRPGEPPSKDDSQNQTPSARDTTTVTTTCGNGPIIVLPLTITEIHCEGEAQASGRRARASLS